MKGGTADVYFRVAISRDRCGRGHSSELLLFAAGGKVAVETIEVFAWLPAESTPYLNENFINSFLYFNTDYVGDIVPSKMGCPKGILTA